jgi:hypothetical protein
MNELYSIRMTGDSVLQHYGVTGMKWGHRKSKSELRTNVSTARKNLMTSTRNFGSAYAKAYAYSLAHPVSQFKSKKRNVEANKRWRNAMTTTTGVKRSLAAYSKAKKIYKTERNAAYKKSITSAGHKFIAKILESNENYYRSNQMSDAANMYKRDKERHLKAAK